VNHRVQLDLAALCPFEEWGAAELEVLFNELEIKDAIFLMIGDKAPCPDGPPTLIFQEFWEVPKGDVIVF